MHYSAALDEDGPPEQEDQIADMERRGIGPDGEPVTVPLSDLPLGTHFVCPWNEGQTGVLVDRSSSCAYVDVTRPVQTRTFTARDDNGGQREVTLPKSGGRERETWSNATRVVPV